MENYQQTHTHTRTRTGTRIKHWKQNAPREIRNFRYQEKLKEKYGENSEIRRIAQFRHVPKHIYHGQKELQAIQASKKRKYDPFYHFFLTFIYFFFYILFYFHFLILTRPGPSIHFIKFSLVSCPLDKPIVSNIQNRAQNRKQFWKLKNKLYVWSNRIWPSIIIIIIILNG